MSVVRYEASKTLEYWLDDRGIMTRFPAGEIFLFS